MLILISALAQQPPHLMIARMDIEVDTPSSCIPIIDSLELKSVIGVPKLHIDNENIDVSMGTFMDFSGYSQGRVKRPIPK